MKTNHFLSLLLVCLLIGSSILVQDSIKTNTMNEASLIGFVNGNSKTNSPGTIDLENSFLLPVVKIEGTLLPHLVLPEINIDEKMNRENIYPTQKTDGVYIPSIMLDEINIEDKK